MPKMHIQKSIEINAPVEKVFSILNDFNNWSSWSPWLIMDKNATVDVEEGGKAYWGHAVAIISVRICTVGDEEFDDG